MGNSIYAGPMRHFGMYLLIKLWIYTMLLFMLPMSFSFCTCVSVYNFFDTNNVLCFLYVTYMLWEVMFNKAGLKRKPDHVFEI